MYQSARLTNEKDARLASMYKNKLLAAEKKLDAIPDIDKKIAEYPLKDIFRFTGKYYNHLLNLIENRFSDESNKCLLNYWNCYTEQLKNRTSLK